MTFLVAAPPPETLPTEVAQLPRCENDRSPKSWSDQMTLLMALFVLLSIALAAPMKFQLHLLLTRQTRTHSQPRYSRHRHDITKPFDLGSTLALSLTLLCA